MKVVVKKLADLKRPPRNTRMHTDKQIAEFRRSVEMFGQIRPIVIDEDNVMLAGNGLYDTLLSLGRTEADCYVVTGLTKNEKKKLMLADNRIFDLGVDDMSAFDAIIAELGDDLDVPGYDDDLLRSIMADAEEVEKMMSDYGTVDEDRREQIRSAGDATRKREEAAAQNPSPAAVPDTDNQTGRCIVCPKCGEQIWL